MNATKFFNPQYTKATPQTFDISFAQKLALVYENAPVKENNTILDNSYLRFVADLENQYAMLLRSGYTFEFVTEDPYQSYEQMRADGLKKHLKIFSGGQPNGIMNALSEKFAIPYNWIFRAVHDILGHVLTDNNFTPLGEENAVRCHATYFTKQSLAALMLETRAQNAWVSYGPHLNNTTDPMGFPLQENGSIIFPEQKYFLLADKYLVV